MKTFLGYVNYGCLAAEKRPVWTEGNPVGTATVSEPVEYTMPEGWELETGEMGNLIVTAPWGWTYTPNELLSAKEPTELYDGPEFRGYDKNGTLFRVKLEWKNV